MVTLSKKSIKLPYMEKEKFILLLRLGLNYNRDLGTFSIKTYNNIDKLIDTLRNILKVESLTFLQNCTICGRDFPCSECSYGDSCKTKDLPFDCVCPQCLRREHYPRQSSLEFQ